MKKNKRKEEEVESKEIENVKRPFSSNALSIYSKILSGILISSGIASILFLVAAFFLSRFGINILSFLPIVIAAMIFEISFGIAFWIASRWTKDSSGAALSLILLLPLTYLSFVTLPILGYVGLILLGILLLGVLLSLFSIASSGGVRNVFKGVLAGVIFLIIAIGIPFILIKSSPESPILSIINPVQGNQRYTSPYINYTYPSGFVNIPLFNIKTNITNASGSVNASMLLPYGNLEHNLFNYNMLNSMFALLSSKNYTNLTYALSKLSLNNTDLFVVARTDISGMSSLVEEYVGVNYTQLSPSNVNEMNLPKGVEVSFIGNGILLTVNKEAIGSLSSKYPSIPKTLYGISNISIFIEPSNNPNINCVALGVNFGIHEYSEQLSTIVNSLQC